MNADVRTALTKDLIDKFWDLHRAAKPIYDAAKSDDIDPVQWDAFYRAYGAIPSKELVPQGDKASD